LPEKKEKTPSISRKSRLQTEKKNTRESTREVCCVSGTSNDGKQKEALPGTRPSGGAKPYWRSAKGEGKKPAGRPLDLPPHRCKKKGRKGLLKRKRMRHFLFLKTQGMAGIVKGKGHLNGGKKKKNTL